MSEPKRLHPIMIVLTIGKKLNELIFTFIALIFLANKGEGAKFILFGTMAIAFVYILISSILSWLRYTYRLEQGELRIEYGVLVRKKRYIPLERIQSIDISEGVLQRLFGLVKIKIETAGGGGDDEAEAVLSAISKEEVRYIQEYVAAAKNSTNVAENVVESESIYKITSSQLVLLSLTSGGVGVVISAVFAFLSQLDDFIPYEKVFRGFETWWAVGNVLLIAVFVFLGFLLAWVAALFGTMLKYANFTVLKTDQDLIITQGLLERRQITIPLNRIQAIRVNENIVRQMLGYGTVYVESAGGSLSNQEGAKVVLLPLVKLRDIWPLLSPHLTDYQMNPSFTAVPKRAMARYILRTWFWAIPIVVVSLIFLKIWGLFSLVLLALVTWWAILKYQDAGWNLEEQQLSLRYRTMVRTTVFLKKNKIQSLEMTESYFQRNKELASIEAYVKVGIGGSGGHVVDMDKNDVEEIYRWYSRK